jgi:cytochrome bd-type quinol oxidase subunit 2
MRDEEYESDQIAAYGAPEQPAVAARMAPHLRMTLVGAVLAALSVVAAVAALITFPRFTTASASGLGWGVLLLLCCVLMLAICAVQLAAWRQAMAWWGGRREVAPAKLAPLSWWLHVVSYLVAVAALWAAMAGSAAAGWSASAAQLLAAALLLVLGAQILGGVQYVRASGPPGTVPAHMRRLLARERARQAAAAAIVERDSPDEVRYPGT